MWRKKTLLIVSALMITFLVACGAADESDNSEDDGELKMLEVDFDVPEAADVDDTIQLEAFVTYGDDPVIDADEVDFEIWEMCDQDNSVHEQPTNNDDGTYTLEYAFEKDGIYEVYAHTTAHDMHTMPKKQIEVGAGGEYDCDENEAEEHHEHDEDHDDDDHEEHE